jgi:dTDP-glucose pyrophosphorylase
MTINLTHLSVDSTHTLKAAIARLDKTVEKIVFVVNEIGTLVGSLTDGDVRRWILQGGQLNSSVLDVCNKNPYVIFEHYDSEEIKQVFLKQHYLAIPVVSENHVLLDILLRSSFFHLASENLVPPKKSIKMPAIIMAGGFGTRLDPFTKILPKPLIPIGDKTIIEIIIDKFRLHQIEDFYISVNYKSKIIKSFFEELAPSYNLHFIDETIPLGTVGCLKSLSNIESKSILISNCDIIINTDYSDFVEFHEVNENEISLVASLMNFKIPYGVCEIKNQGELIRIIEKPEYDFLASTGMYIINTKVLSEIPDGLIFHITDLIDVVKERGGKIGVFPISSESWMDTGEWSEYKKTVSKMSL